MRDLNVTSMGSVVEVERNSPPTLFHFGEGLRQERLPLGSRIIYPPSPLPGIRNPERAIRQALQKPQDEEPLVELLRPGMRLTIAIDDISLPLPPMVRPDVRQLILEEVLDLAAEKQVEDIHLIVANSLHRRMTPSELRRMVGDRVFDAFWPERLYNHDAEDPDNLTLIGKTPEGEVVEINRRAAESDLLVYVNINLVMMDGGHKSVPVGLGSYRSLRHHHNVDTMLHSRSYMDPQNSALHHSCTRMGRLLADAVRIFTIETTLNNRAFPDSMAFLQKRETDWTSADHTRFALARRSLELAPRPVARAIFQSMRAPYSLTGVNAGETEAVHRRTMDAVARQQAVEVHGQTDILTVGLPYLSPYNVNSIMNPILVMCLGLGYFFNLYRGKPLVRPGGVMIMTHPVPEEFHSVHHPSYIDFFEEVLSQTTDPAEIERTYERRFAEDPWYRHLYRTSYAYHGVHPFYMWYWGAHALDYLGDVIFVGGDRKTVRRMGFKAASTLDDALEMAQQTVGRQPSLTHLHAPPLFLCDVK